MFPGNKLISYLFLLLVLLAPHSAASETCRPIPAQEGTGGVTLCEYVLSLSCPARGLRFTGFLAEVEGEVGVITALHAVADCPAGGIAEWNRGHSADLRLDRIDIRNDVAFLTGHGLGLTGLDFANELPGEQLRVVGFSGGAQLQFETYLDLSQKQPVPLAAVDLPSQVRDMLHSRKSPTLQTNAWVMVGELNRGHSGAPILDESGQVIAIGNGGLRAFDSDTVWAIPTGEIDWSRHRVSSIRSELGGRSTDGLMAYFDDEAGASSVSLPPILLADSRDNQGPIYRHDAYGTSIPFTWGDGRLYSLATLPGGRVVFSNHNDANIYEIVQGNVRVLHRHSTYTRDVEFDAQGRLYFSESSGAGGNGRIYRIWRGNVSEQMEVKLDHVDGFWAGRFAFAPDNTIWLASGNRIPASLYEVRDGKPRLRYRTNHPINGFSFLDEDTIVFTDGRQAAHTLHLPSMTKGEAIRLGTAGALSDVALTTQERSVAFDPPKRPLQTVGHLVVPNGSAIHDLNDIHRRTRLCGNPDTYERAASDSAKLRGAQFASVSAAEAYTVLVTGSCDGLVVSNLARFKAALGGQASSFRAIELRAR